MATLPTCGPPLIMPPVLSRGDPPGGRGYVATLPTCGPPVILPPPPPLCEAVGTPLGGKGYVATLPTCGPLLLVSPALKRLGPPKRKGLCSHLAHLWATCDSAPCCEAVRPPKAARLM